MGTYKKGDMKEAEKITDDPFENEITGQKNSGKDLIDEFKEILMKYSDTPEEFAEAGGYAVISATAGRYFMSRLEFKGRPNVWMCLSSIPGRRRRSTVLEAVDFVVKRVNKVLLKERAEKKLQEIKEKVKKKEEEGKKKKQLSLEDILYWTVEDSIIEDGSAEGIADQIQGSDLDVYHISNEEFGCAIKETYGEGYKSGNKVLFSKLYDGNGGKVALSQRGGKKGVRRIKPGLYVTMFCGMQEVHLYVTEFTIRQGVQRRIFMVYVPVDHRYMDYLSTERALFWYYLSEYADKVIAYVEECKKYTESNKNFYDDDISFTYKGKSDFIDVMWDVGVDTEVNRVDKEACMAVDVKEPTLKDIAKLSYGQHLAKFCMIREIAKMKIDDLSDKNKSPKYTLVVRKDSLGKALKFIEKVGDRADESFDKIEEAGSSKTFKTTSTEKAKIRILNFIGKSMPNGVVRSKITDKFKNSMKAEELDTLLSELLLYYDITMEKVITGGRSKTVYKIKAPKKDEEGT